MTAKTPKSASKNGSILGSVSGKKKRKSSSGKSASEAVEKRWRPLPVRLSHGSAFTRHVYLRAPSRDATGFNPEGLALFVAAVPGGWGEAHLREVMARFGAVAEASLVTLDSAPDVAGGLVRFEEAKGLERALASAVENAPPLDPPESFARAVGLESWVNEHRDARPGPEMVQSSLDEWFAAFEAEEERKAAAAKEEAAADDGWTVVEAKRGRRKTTDDEGTAVGGIRAATADQRRKPGLQPKENFYRFQQREKRRSELYELQQKFNADKERVAKLKASRKFRPL